MESSDFFEQRIENKVNPTILNDNGNFIVTKTQKLNRFIVTKELHSSKKESPIFLEAIKREFDIVVQLDHPNIIKYFDYSDFTISMEYVDGENLNQTLNKNPNYFTEQKLSKFILGLLDILSYLHQKNTYHHDIKPENILITHIGENLKLIDFGHAVSDQNISTWGGTKNYIPVGATKDISPKRDFYAVSKILKQIVSTNPKLKTKKMEKLIVFLSESNFTISIEEAKNILLKKSNRILYFGLPIVILTIAGTFFILKNKENNYNSKFKNEVLANSPTTKMKKNLQSQSQNNLVGFVNLKTERRKTKLNSTPVDTIYLKKLGESYYEDFERLARNKNLNIQEQSHINDSLSEIIQKEWWTYAGQYEETSEEYKIASETYLKYYSGSGMKIMIFMYESGEK